MKRPTTAEVCQVAIIGGGPVGALLGCLLAQRGIDCRVLERRCQPVGDSRAIGVHSRSLELLHRVGLDEQFVASGVKVERGQAFINRRHVGTIEFNRASRQFPFALSLPQSTTERLLLQRLRELKPGALRQGVQSVLTNPDRPVVAYQQGGKEHLLEAEVVVGCDGKHGLVRQQLGIGRQGCSFGDRFVMGDFEDNTSYGADAIIHLHRAGLVESFPLPDQMRRWVVEISSGEMLEPRQQLVAEIFHRVGHNLGGVPCQMVSRFQAECHLAEQLVCQRMVLVGDAAHVVTPLGGHGMNLGWYGAALLARALGRGFAPWGDLADVLQGYQSQLRWVASKLLLRTGFDLYLGRRPRRYPRLRKAFVWTLLNTPAARVMERVYTMGGLETWPV